MLGTDSWVSLDYRVDVEEEGPLSLEFGVSVELHHQQQGGCEHEEAGSCHDDELEVAGHFEALEVHALRGLPEHADDEDNERVEVEEAHDVRDGQTEAEYVADEEGLGEVAEVEDHFFEQRDVRSLHLVGRGDGPDQRAEGQEDLQAAKEEQHFPLVVQVVHLPADEDRFPVFRELDVVVVSG